ncbi:hypothetical protein TARUN_6387 [Trichoderma arundinaceum]|uniref:Uncharacterized protein n=1 Tax=Trichoderma arundinaceum TaxID=490622 RepID=A0A395NIZ8_TRIAR|nr:hypothetical protein TARUN_6387 [Trichoderma arundinaceum]
MQSLKTPQASDSDVSPSSIAPHKQPQEEYFPPSDASGSQNSVPLASSASDTSSRRHSSISFATELPKPVGAPLSKTISASSAGKRRALGVQKRPSDGAKGRAPSPPHTRTAMRQMPTGVQGLLQDIVFGEMDRVQFIRDTFALLRALFTHALGTKLPAKDGQSISLESPSKATVAVGTASDAALSHGQGMSSGRAPGGFSPNLCGRPRRPPGTAIASSQASSTGLLGVAALAELPSTTSPAPCIVPRSGGLWLDALPNSSTSPPPLQQGYSFDP